MTIPTRRGKAIEYNDEMELQHPEHFQTNNTLRSKGESYRAGTIDRPSHMEEGDSPGGIADQTQASVRNAAMEEFAKKIKNAVSAKLMGRKINLNLKGYKNIVEQVVSMIKLEVKYLNAVMMGQAADTPALQKNKAIIEAEANKLDRMMGVTGFWPFK